MLWKLSPIICFPHPSPLTPVSLYQSCTELSTAFKQQQQAAASYRNLNKRWMRKTRKASIFFIIKQFWLKWVLAVAGLTVAPNLNIEYLMQVFQKIPKVISYFSPIVSSLYCSGFKSRGRGREWVPYMLYNVLNCSLKKIKW